MSKTFEHHVDRTAEFKDISKAKVGDDWSYSDTIHQKEVQQVIDHVFYGRMVQSVYHLTDSDLQSERYGDSALDNQGESLETQRFIEVIFENYKVESILKATTDTPNQLNSITGKFLSEIANRNMNNELCKGNFMGFIAYNEKEQDLAIIFRGTIFPREWIQNIATFGYSWNDTDVSGDIDCGCDKPKNLEDRRYKMSQLANSLYEVSVDVTYPYFYYREY